EQRVPARAAKLVGQLRLGGNERAADAELREQPAVRRAVLDREALVQERDRKRVLPPVDEVLALGREPDQPAAVAVEVVERPGTAIERPQRRSRERIPIQ